MQSLCSHAAHQHGGMMSTALLGCSSKQCYTFFPPDSCGFLKHLNWQAPGEQDFLNEGVFVLFFLRC